MQFPKQENRAPKVTHWPDTVLLLSDDQTLANLVAEVVTNPWKLVSQAPDGYLSLRIFSEPNVRLVILDDQTVKESDRGWLLAQIRKDFSGCSLFYVTDEHSEHNERRARTNGVHYYTSKPISDGQFGKVLLSFLQALRFKG